MISVVGTHTRLGNALLDVDPIVEGHKLLNTVTRTFIGQNTMNEYAVMIGSTFARFYVPTTT